MSPHKAALAQASVPVVVGIAGFFKLGRFHWGLLLAIIVLAAFAYRSAYQRAKYGTPPTKSLIFGEIAGRPPQV